MKRLLFVWRVLRYCTSSKYRLKTHMEIAQAQADTIQIILETGDLPVQKHDPNQPSFSVHPIPRDWQ